MAWDRNVHGDYRAALKLDVDNKPGVLAQVAAAVAECDSNIDSVEYRERDLQISVMEFGIEVRDRKHLADVIRPRAAARRGAWGRAALSSARPKAAPTG
jgi:guanosine-3',5'-bis(diphosphate) 3'-pyrophosphohydrolase